MAQALDGTRVVVFGGFAAGPQVGTYLAHLGATVVHVESRKWPDGFRWTYAPFKDNVVGVNRGGLFNYYNDSQLGITLNLKAPQAPAVGQRLARWADVLIENFTPGTMARNQLGYEDLRAVNPRLIYFSTCNFGQSGPQAHRPGFGSQLTALAGFPHLTGFPDRSPQPVFGPYIDFVAVSYGVAAVLTALEHREQTGAGQYIDLAQYETGVHYLAGAVLDYQANGRVPIRDGNRSPSAAPHNAYPCREGMWITISCWSDDEWQALCQAAGQPGWARDPRFATLADRKANEADLDELIAAWTAQELAPGLMHRLQGLGIHAGLVNTIRELLDDPNLNYRQVWQPQQHPEIGIQHHFLAGYQLGATPLAARGPAPCLGQHNDRVYREFLGFSEAEYRALQEGGALE